MSDNERETVADFIARRNITVAHSFRGAGPIAGEGSFSDDPRATHWGITIVYNNRQMHTSYHMGSGHYRWKRSGEWGKKGERVAITSKFMAGGSLSLWGAGVLKAESEPISPNPDDVLDGLRSDASGVYDARDFEDWASNYGYDTDSRKAEETYRSCQKIARDLEKLLGREAMHELLATEPL